MMNSGVSYVHRLKLIKVGATAKDDKGGMSVLSKGEYVARPDEFLRVLEEYKHDAIQEFCEEVNTLAIELMVKTGTLEGSHRAAMVRICKQRGIALSDGFGN